MRAFRPVSAQIVTDIVRLQRLERTTALLRRLKPCDTKCVFFTDEMNLYLNPPISDKNNRDWSGGKKQTSDPIARWLNGKSSRRTY
jgi:hypothetical protein